MSLPFNKQNNLQVFETKLGENIWCYSKYAGLLVMLDCWLVSIRKVLQPASSTQVFLGFPVSVSKC